MRKHPFALSALILILLSASVRAQETPADDKDRRGVDLFERGHWADARHELLRAQAEAGDPTTREKIDYYLAVCAVELGRPDAETALLDYEKRHPGSFRANDVRFARASYS